jgi:hypothetical protein
MPRSKTWLSNIYTQDMLLEAETQARSIGLSPKSTLQSIHQLLPADLVVPHQVQPGRNFL